MAQTTLADLIRKADTTKDTTFDLLPPGEYDAQVWEVVCNPAKSGNPMLKVTYKITDGDFKGRLVWQYIVFTENNLHFSVRHALAIGAESQDAVAEAVINPPALDFCKTLVDNLVTLRLGIEKGKDGYDDKNNVKNVVPRNAVAGDADALSGSKPAEHKEHKAAKASSRPSTPF